MRKSATGDAGAAIQNDPDRTGALTRLQEAALKRFASQGYAGTSLAQIAGDAGIKPPSIYAHFKGKDALFLSLVAPAVFREVKETEEALSAAKNARTALKKYLVDLGDRFISSPHTRFLTLTAYLPPPHLHKDIHGDMQRFIAMNGRIIEQAVARLDGATVSVKVLTAAYQGIVDSLQTEIVYMGKQAFQTRLTALWAIFSLAL